MPSIDDFQQQICHLAPTHTHQAIHEWLQEQGVQTSLRTIRRRLDQWQAGRYTQVNVNHSDYAQLTEHINDLFHHQPTYSDRQIAHRIQEEHSLYTTANQVQEIRLLHHWHRRENDAELREAARVETEQFIHYSDWQTSGQLKERDLEPNSYSVTLQYIPTKPERRDLWSRILKRTYGY
jgi:Fe2+ or Zn2+ uptake regulation protein